MKIRQDGEGWRQHHSFNYWLVVVLALFFTQANKTRLSVNSIDVQIDNNFILNVVDTASLNSNCMKKVFCNATPVLVGTLK